MEDKELQNVPISISDGNSGQKNDALVTERKLSIAVAIVAILLTIANFVLQHLSNGEVQELRKEIEGLENIIDGLNDELTTTLSQATTLGVVVDGLTDEVENLNEARLLELCTNMTKKAEEYQASFDSSGDVSARFAALENQAHIAEVLSGPISLFDHFPRTADDNVNGLVSFGHSSGVNDPNPFLFPDLRDSGVSGAGINDVDTVGKLLFSFDDTFAGVQPTVVRSLDNESLEMDFNFFGGGGLTVPPGYVVMVPGSDPTITNRIVVIAKITIPYSGFAQINSAFVFVQNRVTRCHLLQYQEGTAFDGDVDTLGIGFKSIRNVRLDEQDCCNDEFNTNIPVLKDDLILLSCHPDGQLPGLAFAAKLTVDIKPSPI